MENDGVLVDTTIDDDDLLRQEKKVKTEEHILSILEGFFKEASKYASGLIGIERYLKVFKTARKLKFGDNWKI